MARGIAAHAACTRLSPVAQGPGSARRCTQVLSTHCPCTSGCACHSRLSPCRPPPGASPGSISPEAAATSVSAPPLSPFLCGARLVTSHSLLTGLIDNHLPSSLEGKRHKADVLSPVHCDLITYHPAWHPEAVSKWRNGFELFRGWGSEPEEMVILEQAGMDKERSSMRFVLPCERRRGRCFLLRCPEPSILVRSLGSQLSQHPKPGRRVNMHSQPPA